MIDRHEYPVSVRWSGQRQGIATSSDRLPELVITPPPEFGGPPHQWSPEHLFVASVASCFLTTFLALAAKARLEVEGLEVPASGRLVRGEDRRYSIDRVVLEPRIRLAGDGEAVRERAMRLAAKAEEHCLISRSIRCEVLLRPLFEAGDAT